MSTSSPAPATTPAAKKARSPVERLIVWGGILVLLGLVGVEYTARSSYDSALETLRSKMENVDSKSDAAAVTETEVKTALGGKAADDSKSLKGKTPANGAARVDVYSWFTLNPFSPRQMLIYYGVGDNPEVIEIKSEEVAYETFTPVVLRPITEEERENYADTHDMYGQEIPSKKAAAAKREADRKKRDEAKAGEVQKDVEKKDGDNKDAEKKEEGQ